jgi:uncharacterized PurR-regulated membrane protein YhhQ (DUF165 family)
MIEYLTLKIILGAIAGCLWGGFGFAVAKLNGEIFEPKKFGKTVLVGFILGLVGSAVGVDISTVENYSVLQLLTIVADKLTGTFME